MTIQPVGARILLRPIKQDEKTASGIYLPESARTEKKQGVVEAVGTHDDKPIPLQKGEKVLYGGYSDEEFEIDGEEYIIIKYEDVLAKVN